MDFLTRPPGFQISVVGFPLFWLIDKPSCPSPRRSIILEVFSLPRRSLGDLLVVSRPSSLGRFLGASYKNAIRT